MARALSPVQQWVRLKSSLICHGHGLVRMGELIWDFNVKPSSLSRTYLLRIRFKRPKPPKITVLKTNLNELAGGRYLPHLYSVKPVQLCLYSPKHDEWTIDKSLADTIVPWSYLWLIHFEHWLATDEWLGGGEHPGEN